MSAPAPAPARGSCKPIQYMLMQAYTIYLPSTPALHVTIVRIVGLCLLPSPIARTMAAFHISLALPVTLTLLVYINRHALTGVRQFFSTVFFSFIARLQISSLLVYAPELCTPPRPETRRSCGLGKNRTFCSPTLTQKRTKATAKAHVTQKGQPEEARGYS